ncbi:MAG: hypothetical protein RLZZ524_164, partial [Pseudomonadota bacterium]
AVDGQVVPRELWAIAKPKAGTLITLRAQAEGGDGSNPLAIVATLVLAIVAPYAVGALSLATGMAFTPLVAGFIQGAVMLVGGMVINALFAPPAAKLSDGRAPEVSPTYSLSGGSNQVRPYGPLPLVLGKHRVFPDLASKPYTEFAGDDQYLIQLFNFGYGSLRLSDFRIGQTPLTSYTDIVTEESGADGVLYRFPGNVDSVTGGVLGSGTPEVSWPTPTDDTAWVTRTSGVNAILMAVDIEASIYALNADGPQPWSIELQIEYRIVGGAWTSMLSTVSYNLENASLKPVRRTFYSPQLTPAQYEVRVRRMFGEDTREIPETQFEDAATWATLRTYQLDPASYEAQRRYGIWVKATGQLNGVLQRVSALAESSVPAWNGSAWADAYTSNPAWLFLYFARGGFAASGRLLWGAGLADARIDIDGLTLWGAYCTENGLEFNAVIDRSMSVAEVLNAIARCGRGSITWATGKLGVAWDDSEAAVVAQFGMSSIKAGTFEIQWASGQLADEIVVQFTDQDADYEQSEVRVLAPGTSVPTLTQTTQWLGATSRSMAGKMANLLMANNTYRSRKITFETDAEGLVVTRGDRILLSHDLTQWGYSGRLTAATTTRIDLDRIIPSLVGVAEYIALVAPNGTETYHLLSDRSDGWYDYVTLTTPLSASSVPGTAFPSSPLCDWKWRFDFTPTPGKRVKIAALEPIGERLVRVICVDDPVEYHGMSVLGYTYVARTATQPATPTISGLVLTETLVLSGGAVSTHLVATWNTLGELVATRVRWHDGDGVWIVVGDVAGRRAEFAVPDAVTVTVEVSVFNGVGQQGENGSATATHYVVGKTAPPPCPDVLNVAGQGDGTRELSWAYTVATPPLDLAGYRVRYVSGSSGTWETMTPLHAGLLTASPYEFNSLAAGTWTFALKAVDLSGNESAAAIYATAVLLDPRMGGILYQIEAYAAAWPGTKTDCWVDAITGWLEAASTDTWTTLPPWESWNQWSSNPVTSMTYEHSVIDIGVITAFTPNAACTGIGSFLVEEAHSNDGVSYSSWATAGSKVTGRYVKLRAVVTPTVADQAMRLQTMNITLDAKTIEEWIIDSATSGWTGTTGDRRVPITKTYAVIQQVSVTLQSTGAGWSWELIDRDAALGPRIKIYNSSNALADATVDVYVKGL